ncbi:hypothetical protein PV963_25940 [Streptomyces coeruleorubidus]|uniref:hypothetical protein n=1 Tax=Streptomyces coeruleorubidus TaxID=116188 RepID=UPI00237F1E90|nr:hypothetical protein [Streptomyces coeruleorubidus]WDV53555.1 hypothetical protein PV963_25940 [Streptomyces coeruleorubidus]
MSITQQHLLDTYRARQLGESAPPAPGTHDWQVVREWRDERQFRAVLAGRPARPRFRDALNRWRRRPT